MIIVNLLRDLFGRSDGCGTFDSCRGHLTRLVLPSILLGVTRIEPPFGGSARRACIPLNCIRRKSHLTSRFVKDSASGFFVANIGAIVFYK